MLVKYRPQRTRGLAKALSDMNIFDNSLDDLTGEIIEEFNSLWNPNPLDVHETDSDFVIVMEVPGFEKGDLEARIEDDMLHIFGETKSDETATKKSIFKKKQKTISRKIYIPPTVSVEGAVADLSNGILTIHLPKKEKATGHRIEIT